MRMREFYDQAQKRLRPVLRTVPASRSLAAAIEFTIKPLVRLFYRVALSPFAKYRRSSFPDSSSMLESHTEDYNLAAEQYFRDFDDHDFLLTKPFSESEEFPNRLFNLGVLFKGIRLVPTDVVVDFGAGSCWMSHFINRFGCKTISIDVSPTALDLGRKLFESDPRTNWNVGPEFVSYDGHTLPLPDGCCDKILINDAFHHVPNQREVLLEFARILRPDGIVGMREPGQSHSEHPTALQESETGVLENDIVIEDLAALAEDCGLAEAAVIPASPHALVEIPASDLGPFMTGKGFVHYWTNLCNALQNDHFLFLYKDSTTPTTRTPRVLSADIWSSSLIYRLTRGESKTIRLWVRNDGDTTWLGSSRENQEGWTRIGGHLYRAGSPPTLIDFDWLRVQLPDDVSPDQERKIPIKLPTLDRPGAYVVELEMVIEDKCWFGSHETGAHTIELIVR